MQSYQWLMRGVLDLPWWQLALVALAFTHVTIAAVTIYLHRHQSHRSLDLHPIASHFFRFWLWLTTGMITKEWAAVHRKHHARVDSEQDPHSPQMLGLNRVLWAGVFLYTKEAANTATLERFGRGTPDDWLERNVYSGRNMLGIVLMALVNVVLFGPLPGAVIFLVQMLWIPFWAAGVINGVGHFFGYRNFHCEDASRNIVPLGILIGGEELHNNHHAFASSAKLSSKWYEFDIGWLYIRILEVLGLAKVNKVIPRLRLITPKPVPDEQTLQAIITHRYEVLASYAKSLKIMYAEEMRKLKQFSSADGAMPASVKGWVARDGRSISGAIRAPFASALSQTKSLATMYYMRDELSALWQRSSASSGQLVTRLQDWCRSAEQSGIAPLVQFSHRLRCYA